MPAPAISFAPTGAWKLEAMDKEAERAKKSRLETRDALKKIGDEFAANGQSMTMDSLYQAMRDQMGDSAMLMSNAPSQDLLQSMVANQNAKAQQTQAAQQYEAATRRNALQKDLTANIEDMVRQNPSIDNEKLRKQLADTYGDEQANMMLPKLDGIRQKVTTMDFADGIKIGATFPSTKEADQYIAGMPGLTEGQKRGIKQAAQAEERKATAKVAEVALGMASPVLQDDGPTREALKIKLTALGMGDAETVDKAMGIAISASRQAGRTDRYNTGKAFEQPAAVKMWVDQIDKDRDDERAGVTDAEKQALMSNKARSDGVVNLVQVALGKVKNPKPDHQAAAAEAQDFMLRYSVPDQGALAAAISNGPDAVRAEITRQRQGATPAAASISADRQRAIIASGADVLPQDAGAAYRQVAMIGYDPAFVERLGSTAAYYKGQGNIAQAEKEVMNFVERAAQGALKTRELLSQSRRYGASADQLAAYQHAAIVEVAKPFSAKSGASLEEIVRQIEMRVPPPTNINPVARPGEVFGAAAKAAGADYRAPPGPASGGFDGTVPVMNPNQSERAMRVAAQLTPEQIARGDRYDRHPSNIAELQQEIARKDISPEQRMILLQELVKITSTPGATAAPVPTAPAALYPAPAAPVQTPPPQGGGLRAAPIQQLHAWASSPRSGLMREAQAELERRRSVVAPYSRTPMGPGR